MAGLAIDFNCAIGYLPFLAFLASSSGIVGVDLEISPVIVITDLVKQFGRFAALRGVSADFAAGRLYTILGDNGAGKTTLLRALGRAGCSRHAAVFPCSGAPICARFAANWATWRIRRCSTTKWAAWKICAILRGFTESRMTNRCAETMTAVDLDPALARPVAHYSQGMRQRLSLARALLNDPKILLLDEPFSNVDIRSRESHGFAAGADAERGQNHFRGDSPGVVAAKARRTNLSGWRPVRSGAEAAICPRHE